MQRILLADDQTGRRSALRHALERGGYEVAEACSVKHAGEHCGAVDIALIIARMRLPDGRGTDIVQPCRQVPVLIVTGRPSVESAIESIRQGAVDYVPESFNDEVLIAKVEEVLRKQGRRPEVASGSPRPAAVAGMGGTQLILKGLHNTVARAAQNTGTVLILGEYGTGKALVAQAIHEKSKWRATPLTTLNCVAIPEGMLEAALGRPAQAGMGAPPSAQDQGPGLEEGTLFLDQVGELAGPEQAYVRRFLQERERGGRTPSSRLGVRVLAATHQDLPALAARRRFDPELYFKLRVVEIRVPPLRERGEDIIRLAEHFLARTAARFGRGAMTLTPGAIAAATAYAWPGNVVELQNAIERAVILADSPHITHELLGLGNERAVSKARACRRGGAMAWTTTGRPGNRLLH